jgi:hypothetical protein
MNFEDKILGLFDDYFKSAPKEEIERDIAYINSIGMNGVSFEEYITILNSATSYNLRDAGICDDIAFADLFNKTIRGVEMGNNKDIKIGQEPLFIPDKLANYSISTYVLAPAA